MVLFRSHSLMPSCVFRELRGRKYEACFTHASVGKNCSSSTLVIT